MTEDPFACDLGIRKFSERIKTEREDRLAQAKRGFLSLGIGFLNETLGGIFPNDFILLGAKTGKGKTSIATQIALDNVMRGKRVHYFALEGEPNEIERRIKYRLLADKAWES